MDEQWLISLDRTVCILVPTRSLQNDLHSRVARAHLTTGVTVWESPNILTWGEFLNRLWLANRSQIKTASVLIDAAQSRILWERVIEQTKRKDDELTLLNVPQTARAVLRSWQLAHDWQIDTDQLSSSAIKDTKQFGDWCKAYGEALSKQNLLDSTGLFQSLIELLGNQQLKAPFCTTIWYGFDLMTAAQRKWREASEEQGFEHLIQSPTSVQPKLTFKRFESGRDELKSVLQQARVLVQQNPDQRINIVVPNLQYQQAQLRAIAAEVFYPGWSPLRLLNNDLVYRFSLGQPMADWAPITCALRVLKTMDGRFFAADLSWLLRNQFLRCTRTLSGDTRQFDRWLQANRVSFLTVDSLPQLVLDSGVDQDSKLVDFANSLRSFHQRLSCELDDQAAKGRYKTLKLASWRVFYSQWLDLWGWSTAVTSDNLSSLQYQLLERWQQLLVGFEGLHSVQARAGFRRALDLLQQTARDQVFLPKASASPIFISGVYEALGMTTDVCFLTGMTEHYPAAIRVDPFIGDELRKLSEYPSATPAKYLHQSQKVTERLLQSAKRCDVSYHQYSDPDPSIELSVSSLFRHQEFALYDRQPTRAGTQLALETFTDTRGPSLKSAKHVTGGTSIFTDQSNCAFKAFARHRLRCSSEVEPEFGLDALDRGNVVHYLLERCWQKLQSKSELNSVISDGQLDPFVENVVQLSIQEYAPRLNAQRQQLLMLEMTRLKRLLTDWLELEAERPIDFYVSATEEQGEHQVGGIRFSYKVDRIDFTDDGKTIVLDYKTGLVNRADLYGSRLRQPQLPLYVQAISAQKNRSPSGIALGQVRQHACKIEELSEIGLFQRRISDAQRYQDAWAEAKATWPRQLEQLATEFIAGEARVNPLDADTCKFCDLQSFCRIKQMRAVDQDEPKSEE